MKYAAVLVAVALSVGCSHAVNITSTPPGADIYVDKKKVGTTPTTYTEETGSSGQVEIVAKANGKEKKVTVAKDKFAPLPIGAGAGAGAGACLVIGGASWVVALVSVVAGTVFPPCLLGALCPWLSPVGCLAIPAGAGVGWFMFGNQMPDTVNIDMADAGAAAPEVAPPTSAAPNATTNPAAAY
jgi:hypothetical protein